jgi:acetyl-CoA synthetase
MKWVRKDKKKHVFWPTNEMKERAWISKESVYREAARDPKKFWAKLAKKGLTWYKKWNKIYSWNPPYFKWFVGGKINACYNAVDRHLETWRRNKIALIWIPEPVTETRRVLTYYDLYNVVNRLASVLKGFGVRRGDTVGIYMPMIPEIVVSMLACARIGAVHSVVFSAFSAASLNDRLENAGAKVLITADGYYRRGKIINLKANAEKGVKGTRVKRVIVVKRAGI